jgi:superfamily II DNA or RNA helicase
MAMQGNYCMPTEKSLGKRPIFNNGINTSLYVYETFRDGVSIRHLDNTSSTEERKDILQWFKTLQTSVGILTTGFDEPTGYYYS